MHPAFRTPLSKFPRPWQNLFRRIYFASQFRQGRFRVKEPEYAFLHEWVKEGNWVIDIGANQGRYTARLSELVGASGRILAFEPIPETFHILIFMLSLFRYPNVTAINAAVSESCGEVCMEVPSDAQGIKNFYRSHIVNEGVGLKVLSLSVDALHLQHPVSFVKIDAEGHELSVLRGMQGILERFKPRLLIEDNSPDVSTLLHHLGYSRTKHPGSPNAVYHVP